MANSDTHISIAAELRRRAGSLRFEDGSASDNGEYTGHSIRIACYEIAAAIHGLTAAFYIAIDSADAREDS